MSAEIWTSILGSFRKAKSRFGSNILSELRISHSISSIYNQEYEYVDTVSVPPNIMKILVKQVYSEYSTNYIDVYRLYIYGTF